MMGCVAFKSLLTYPAHVRQPLSSSSIQKLIIQQFFCLHALGMYLGVVKMPFNSLNCPAVHLGNVNKKRTCRRSSSPFMCIKISSILNLPLSKKISSPSLKKSQTPNKSSLSQDNTIGIIGGVSVFSTVIFLEKLVWWSSRNGETSVPFIVCSDPTISKVDNDEEMIEKLRGKRAFLEQSGAGCVVMPCHVSQTWYSEVAKGCSVPFLNVADCVAMELKEANLEPVEVGSDVRIGILAADATLLAGFYQQKLQNQGFEVVLPDKPTMEHTVLAAIEALKKKDIQGATTLLRIAIQLLLVRAVNTVILASDEFRGLLPHDDPLLKKCIDPMDALARSTIQWSRAAAAATEKIHN